MSNPRGTTVGPSSGLGFDPDLYFLELYVAFLQGWFNFLPFDHEFHWEPDLEHSRVAIRGEAPVDFTVMEARPLITVIWGPTATQSLGMDNFVSRNGETNLFTDMESGTFVVYAVAHGDIQAKRLARLIAHATRSSRRLLEGPGGFHAIGRTGLSINSPSAPGSLVMGAPENTDLVMVQINVPIQFQLSWTVAPGRSPPQYRTLDMVTQQQRARDYVYASPVELAEVHLGDPNWSTSATAGVNLLPRTGRIIRGAYAARPATVQIGDGIDGFQQSDLSKTVEE